MNFKLKESRKQNTYRIKYLDYDDNYNFATIDAFSVKQAEYKLRHVYGLKGIARILNIECIEDASIDDGEQLSLFENWDASKGKSEFIEQWNSNSSLQIKSLNINQHHIDRNTSNNPKDFSNYIYLYSTNPDHLRKAHNYIHAKALVDNYNLEDVFVLFPDGRKSNASVELLNQYAKKLPNDFETAQDITEDDSI